MLMFAKVCAMNEAPSDNFATSDLQAQPTHLAERRMALSSDPGARVVRHCLYQLLPNTHDALLDRPCTVNRNYLRRHAMAGHSRSRGAPTPGVDTGIALDSGASGDASYVCR